VIYLKKKDCLNENIKSSENALNAYSLAGIGIGGIIGSGFFLGSSLAINEAGPSVILAFLFGGLLMSQVLGAMTSISINRPVKGSFRVYTEQYLGKFMGFLLGWALFTSGILSLASEAIATGIFFKFWMPTISSSLFALVSLIIVIGINRLGTKHFGYIESVMSVIICTVDWNIINTDISPFVQSFNNIGYGWASSLINAAILVSTFSVMIGTYYGCVQMLTSLSDAKKAPEILKISTEKGIYKYSWLATGGISILVILMAFVLGSKLFNYLISSSSYFSFFNWITNLITYTIWLKKREQSEIYDSPLIKGRLSAIITIIVILILLVISLGVSDFRIGFYVAISISFIISAFYKFIKQ
jgi:L-asparagine transporter-like permease